MTFYSDGHYNKTLKKDKSMKDNRKGKRLEDNLEEKFKNLVKDEHKNNWNPTNLRY